MLQIKHIILFPIQKHVTFSHSAHNSMNFFLKWVSHSTKQVNKKSQSWWEVNHIHISKECLPHWHVVHPPFLKFEAIGIQTSEKHDHNTTHLPPLYFL